MNIIRYNVVIVGGGASGMCSAILIKRKIPSANVIILESLDRVGKKLIVTGNGRCNITNKFLNSNAYHGKNSEFSAYAISKYGYNFTEDFFKSMGIPLVEGENGKMYPYSLQASSVVDAMRLEIEKLGVILKTGVTVEKISLTENMYKICTNECEYCADNVIIATGGLAGGSNLGSFGIGYNILYKMGFSSIETKPSLVQLKTDVLPIKALNGIKVNAAVSLYTDGKKYRDERGELLFTRYGISGPPVLQVSRGANFAKKDCVVKINFMPEYSYNEIVELLNNRVNILKDRTADYFFTGLLPKMLGHTILKMSNIKLTDSVSSFSVKQCRLLAENIYSFSLNVTGDNGMNNAQVTAGGISTDDFNSKTMESKKYKGLYAIGEVLDIDGDCGGYNLQWAWSSAAAAAGGIVGKLV